MSDDPAIIAEFKVESSEQLQGIENHLLGLENAYGDRSIHINAAFRAMHSIKGGANFLNFQQLAKLTHQMETVLNALRDQKLLPNHHTISALLKGVDRIREMFEDLEHSNQQGIDRELAMLQGLQETSLAEPEAEPEPGLQLLDEAGKAFTLDLHIHQEPPIDRALHLTEFDLLVLAETAGFESINDLWQALNAHTTLYAYRLDSKADKLRRNLPFQPVVLTCLSEAISDGFVAKDHALRGRKVSLAVKAKPKAAVEAKPIKDDDIFVHVSLKLLDRIMTLTGELALSRYRLSRSVPQNSYLHSLSRSIDRITGSLQEAVIATRLNSFEKLFARMQRLVRDLSVKLQKPLELEVFGMEQQVDRRLLQRLNESLVHLVRNACDHGIEDVETRAALEKPETGHISLKVERQGEMVVVTVGDDGRGLDLEKIRTRAVQMGKVKPQAAAGLTKRELLQLVLSPGFSTAQKVNDISGRGVGLDVVRQNIEEMGGSFEIRTKHHQGIRFVLTLPVHLAITSVLLLQARNRVYAVSRSFVKKLVTLYDDHILEQVSVTENGEQVPYQGSMMPLVYLSDVLRTAQPLEDATRYGLALARQDRLRAKFKDDPEHQVSLSFVVLQVGELRYGLVIEKWLEIKDFFVEAMHPALSPLAIFSGCIIQEDGSVVLQLDLMGVARHYGITRAMFEKPKLTVTEKEWISARETLLFESPRGVPMALPMQAVRRVVVVAHEDLKNKNGFLFANLEGKDTFVLEPDGKSQKALPKKSRWYVIVLKGMPNPTAILGRKMLMSQRKSREFQQGDFTGKLGNLWIEGTKYVVPNPFDRKQPTPVGWLFGNTFPDPIGVLLWDRDDFHVCWQMTMLKLLGYQVERWDEAQSKLEPVFEVAFYVTEMMESTALFQRWQRLCESNDLRMLCLERDINSRWSMKEIAELLVLEEAAS